MDASCPLLLSFCIIIVMGNYREMCVDMAYDDRMCDARLCNNGICDKRCMMTGRV